MIMPFEHVPLLQLHNTVLIKMFITTRIKSHLLFVINKYLGNNNFFSFKMEKSIIIMYLILSNL